MFMLKTYLLMIAIEVIDLGLVFMPLVWIEVEGDIFSKYNLQFASFNHTNLRLEYCTLTFLWCFL